MTVALCQGLKILLFFRRIRRIRFLPLRNLPPGNQILPRLLVPGSQIVCGARATHCWGGESCAQHLFNPATLRTKRWKFPAPAESFFARKRGGGSGWWWSMNVMRKGRPNLSRARTVGGPKNVLAKWASRPRRHRFMLTGSIMFSAAWLILLKLFVRC